MEKFTHYSRSKVFFLSLLFSIIFSVSGFAGTSKSKLEQEYIFLRAFSRELAFIKTFSTESPSQYNHFQSQEGAFLNQEKKRGRKQKKTKKTTRKITTIIPQKKLNQGSKSSEKKEKKQKVKITGLRVSTDKKRGLLKVAIQGNGVFTKDKIKHFSLLGAKRKFVIDIYSSFLDPALPSTYKLGDVACPQVRCGKHEDFTRVVFDCSAQIKKYQVNVGKREVLVTIEEGNL